MKKRKLRISDTESHGNEAGHSPDKETYLPPHVELVYNLRCVYYSQSKRKREERNRGREIEKKMRKKRRFISVSFGLNVFLVFVWDFCVFFLRCIPLRIGNWITSLLLELFHNQYSSCFLSVSKNKFKWSLWSLIMLIPSRSR